MSKIIDFHQHLIQLKRVEGRAKLMDKISVRWTILISFPIEIASIPEVIHSIGMKKKDNGYIDTVLRPLDELNSELMRYVHNFNTVEPSEGSDWEKPRCRFLAVPWIPIGLKELNIPKTPDGYHPIMVKFIPIFDNVKNEKMYWEKMSASIDLLKTDIIAVHTGWGSPIMPLAKIIEDHPDRMFVLMHMKEDFDQDNIDRKIIMEKSKKDADNVYLETSYVPHSKRISQYVRAGFSERLLFGSDYRTSEDEQSLRGFLRVIEECDIAQKDVDNILYNNAHKLLKSVGVIR